MIFFRKLINSMDNTPVFFTSVLFLIAVDRLSKYLSVHVSDIVIYNKGIAFGFLSTFPSMHFKLFNALTIFFFIILYFRERHKVNKLFLTGLALIISGSIGNFTDRILFGKVIDWLPLPFTDIFFTNNLYVNIADILLSAGALLILCSIIGLTQR